MAASSATTSDTAFDDMANQYLGPIRSTAIAVTGIRSRPCRDETPPRRGSSHRAISARTSPAPGASTRRSSHMPRTKNTPACGRTNPRRKGPAPAGTSPYRTWLLNPSW